MNFRHLDVGARVVRVVGTSNMLMEITEVKTNTAVCAAVQKDGKLFKGEWEFNRDNGWEEDSRLQWGIKFQRTGSYLLSLEQIARYNTKRTHHVGLNLTK